MEEKLIIQGFNQFGGKHCQTAALKNVLDYHGLHLSEEMLLGLGGGIGFIYCYEIEEKAFQTLNDIVK